MIDCKVNDMAAASLNAGQQVFVMAYSPNAEPSEAAREAARASLLEVFTKIDKYAEAHGITDEEAEAAIEEAMRHLRGRDGYCAILDKQRR